MKNLKISVEVPDWVHCPRCKNSHFCKDNHDSLCDKCCRVLINEHPNHPSVPFILESYRIQREKYGISEDS